MLHATRTSPSLDPPPAPHTSPGKVRNLREALVHPLRQQTGPLSRVRAHEPGPEQVVQPQVVQSGSLSGEGRLAALIDFARPERRWCISRVFRQFRANNSAFLEF